MWENTKQNELQLSGVCLGRPTQKCQKEGKECLKDDNKR